MHKFTKPPIFLTLFLFFAVFNKNKNNLAVIIQKVKIIVESNTILSDGYIFEDLKSIDVVFIFFVTGLSIFLMPIESIKLKIK